MAVSRLNRYAFLANLLLKVVASNTSFEVKQNMTATTQGSLENFSTTYAYLEPSRPFSAQKEGRTIEGRNNPKDIKSTWFGNHLEPTEEFISGYAVTEDPGTSASAPTVTSQTGEATEELRTNNKTQDVQRRHESTSYCAKYDERMGLKPMRCIKMYLTVPLCVIGLIANVCGLHTTWSSQPQIGRRINYYIRILATVDTVYLLSMLLVALGSVIPDARVEEILQLSQPYIFWISYSCVMVSVWITAFITLERALVVARPLKAKIWITTRRHFVLLTFVVLMSFGMVLPRFFEFQADHIYDEGLGRFRKIYVRSKLFWSEEYGVYWNFYAFMRCVPVGMVIVCNTMLIVMIRRTRARRQNMCSQVTAQNDNAAETKMTKTLLAVTSFFCLFNMPHVIHIATYGLHPSRVRNLRSTGFLVFTETAGFLAYNISVWNMVIYVGSTRGFRCIARGLVCCFCKRNEQPGTKLSH